MDNQGNDKGINRRQFISAAPVAAAALAAAPAAIAQANSPNAFTTGDVQKYLRSLDSGWVNWEKTVDNFKSGGPDAVVKGIAVAWMSYTWALKKALDLGCNMFVTHEPTYFNHWDNDKDIFRFETARRKKEFIEQSGITILRCHDLWDQYRDIGIPMSWAKQLELGEPLEGKGYFYVYDGKGEKAGALARKIAARVASLGQPGVQLIGPEEKPVRRVVIGTGAITPMLQFIVDYKADMAICTDDGFTYWRDGAFAIDSNFPVALVNHPVSEENGMILLAGHLKKAFPQVPVHHIPERCMYKIFTA